jgi:hypothetical protein
MKTKFKITTFITLVIGLFVLILKNKDDGFVNEVEAHVETSTAQGPIGIGAPNNNSTDQVDVVSNPKEANQLGVVIVNVNSEVLVDRMDDRAEYPENFSETVKFEDLNVVLVSEKSKEFTAVKNKYYEYVIKKLPLGVYKLTDSARGVKTVNEKVVIDSSKLSQTKKFKLKLDDYRFKGTVKSGVLPKPKGYLLFFTPDEKHFKSTLAPGDYLPNGIPPGDSLLYVKSKGGTLNASAFNAALPTFHTPPKTFVVCFYDQRLEEYFYLDKITFTYTGEHLKGDYFLRVSDVKKK